MTVRTKTVDCGGGEVYTVREITAGYLRMHRQYDTPEAQGDMLATCVLGADGLPMGEAADELIPIRHVAQLLEAILEVSGLEDDDQGKADPLAA